MSTVISATEFIKTAITTAQHYGFQSIDTLTRDTRVRESKSTTVKKVSAADRKLDALHGLLTSGINAYYESRLYGIEEPLLFYSVETVPRTGEIALSLQILGVNKSIAEALLIQTVRSCMRDMGFTEHTVRVNSLGDRDSSARYARELTNYLKKRLDDMPPAARELMKVHACAALMNLIEKDHELAHKSPSPLEYLSDQSRKHFREIIEYLDMTETPYEIDARLMGDNACYSDALFSIDVLDADGRRHENPPLSVQGGRYDEFVRRMTKTQVPATGAVVILRDRKAPSRIPNPRNNHEPSVFVVQLGFGPKIKTLMLIDELKRANIPVHQSIVSDSLSEQLRMAERRGVPFSLILGQKEYVEGTVILRDMRSRSQENVPFDALIPHLKRAVRA